MPSSLCLILYCNNMCLLKRSQEHCGQISSHDFKCYTIWKKDDNKQKKQKMEQTSATSNNSIWNVAVFVFSNVQKANLPCHNFSWVSWTKLEIFDFAKCEACNLVKSLLAYKSCLTHPFNIWSPLLAWWTFSCVSRVILDTVLLL